MSWVFYGVEIMPIPSAADLISSTVTETQFKTKFEQLVKGIDRTYNTLAEANADIANISINTIVTILSNTEGGQYYKATTAATSLTLHPNGLNQQAKSIATKEIDNYKLSNALNNLHYGVGFTLGNLKPDGTTESAGARSYSEKYILINPNSEYLLDSNSYTSFVSVALYDVNKVFISLILKASWLQGFPLSIPSNAFYARFCVLNTGLASFKVQANLNNSQGISEAISSANEYTNKIAKPISIYKTMMGSVHCILDENNELRVISSTHTGELISYGQTSSFSKNLIAGQGISFLETDETITIEAGETVYQTPHEYVLCLIAGQSNASYYGGDANQAPSVPNGVCYIWDNTYNVLRELNDGSSASNTCKQTYAPALALEFYKRTGMGLIVVNSAVGSTAQTSEADNGAGNWSQTGNLRQLSVTRFNNCQAYLKANNFCFQNGFIVWSQGERDGQEIQLNTITKELYKTTLLDMIDFFKTSLGSKLPFILTATAYYVTSGNNTGAKAVRDAQYEVAHEKLGAYMGFTGTVKFPDRGLMSDNVHYSQEGKNIMGTALGKIASILSAGLN